MKSEKQTDELRQQLGLEMKSGSPWRIRFWSMAVLVPALIISGILWAAPGENAQMQYETAVVEKGDLYLTVTATGALEPVNRVDVGTEISGTLKKIHVDYNDRIKAGDILATIDTTRLEAKVSQSRASLEVARARLVETKASVFEARKQLERLRKAFEISGGKLPSGNELDAAEATLKRNQAMVMSAKAQIQQAEAVLKSDQTDLDKSVIRSPVNGIVLERLVESGQTVAASLQSPILFTLAEDLTHMELKVNVDEADVGLVEKGQSAVFTVDAYPDQKFSAVISEVRYAGVRENGVVTYETLLTVDNPDLLLRPGMTATAEISVQKIENALLVPNSALRHIPESAIEKDAGDKTSFLEKLSPRRARRSGSAKSDNQFATANDSPRVFRLEGENPVSTDLSTGFTDGIRTQVLGGALETGDRVVIGTRS